MKFSSLLLLFLRYKSSSLFKIPIFEFQLSWRPSDNRSYYESIARVLRVCSFDKLIVYQVSTLVRLVGLQVHFYISFNRVVFKLIRFVVHKIAIVSSNSDIRSLVLKFLLFSWKHSEKDIILKSKFGLQQNRKIRGSQVIKWKAKTVATI